MKYIIDTEFIDTPSCSALISLAILREDGAHRYFEFEYPKKEITEWLAHNVVPHLTGDPVTFGVASEKIYRFVGKDPSPQFWCYFGAYDWYWFCRLFGGMMQMPQDWPHRFCEFADVVRSVPDVAGAAHNALNDCRSILHAMKMRGMIKEDR